MAPVYATLLSSFLLACVLSAATAAALLENRPPKPGEVGYLPADDSVVPLNPPSLIWLHETGAHTYTVQWSARSDFDDAVTAANLPFNTYTHHAPLAAGRYYWRYRYATQEGANSQWSIHRSFTVPPGAVEFPMPTRAQQRERVPEGRPRLFLRPEDLPRLRELAGGREKERFAALRAGADALLQSEPTPEPTVRATVRDEATRAFWWPNRVQTQKACEEAELLAFVYLITGERQYGEAARRWILHLAGWDPDGPTNFALNCEAAKPMLHRLPRAYDWAYDTLSPEERRKVQQVMLRRAQDAWVSWEVGRGVGHLNRPFNSHGNRTWHKLGECAIAFLGEIPEAETWLDYAVNKFYAAYPVWSDHDGGWHEGMAYWAGYLSKTVWWLQVAQSALGIDGFKKPFFAHVGDFALYVAPPGTPNMGFGNLSNGRPSRGWGGWMEYFVRSMGNRPEGNRSGYWRWYMEQWKMSSQEGILGFLYSANLPPLPEPKPPTDIPQSKVFHGVGVASLHKTLLNSADDVHLLFKASPFGRQSHGHNPQNSFMLNAYGEALLTTCVYRDWHGSPFHSQWAQSTTAHNAVLVNGQGQNNDRLAALGHIVDSRLTPELDYVVGDATGAYEGRLTRYRRHVAFVKPDLIVLYDDLAAAEPSTFQFMLHAFRPFTLQEKGARLGVELQKAGVDVAYLSPAPLAFRQWDGYDPKPESNFPNQWHVEAGTAEKRREIGMLTVILPYRVGERAEWTAERLESPTAIGVRVQRGSRTTLVGFRKHDVAKVASLPGLQFDGPVAVR